MYQNKGLVVMKTLFNLQHKIQGWCDAPLTKLGIEQAKITGKYFKEQNIIFNHSYSSTFKGACDTLDIDHKKFYTRIKELKELNFRVFEAKDDFFKQLSGESELKLRERMFKTLTEIMDKENHETVLAVSYGESKQCSKVKRIEKFYNCCILKLEYENAIFNFSKINEQEIRCLVFK